MAGGLRGESGGSGLSRVGTGEGCGRLQLAGASSFLS
jgi:hypothetical protein